MYGFSVLGQAEFTYQQKIALKVPSARQAVVAERSIQKRTCQKGTRRTMNTDHKTSRVRMNCP